MIRFLLLVAVMLLWIALAANIARGTGVPTTDGPSCFEETP